MTTLGNLARLLGRRQSPAEAPARPVAASTRATPYATSGARSAALQWSAAVERAAKPGSVILSRWVDSHGIEARRRHAASVQASAQRSMRSYAGATMSRTTADWVAASTSADAELFTSLRTLRNRTRQLIRDNEYAKQAVRLIVNNVVGTGVGLQSNVMMRRGNRPDDKANDTIEAAWLEWGKRGSCNTAGKLSWAALQRMVIRCVVSDGEILIRKVKKAFGKSKVPFALEVIESDQLVDTWTGRAPNGNEVRMGVEVDEWLRPVAYWLYPRHPGDNMVSGVPQANDYVRVPADEVIHLAVWDRPNQTRGVPWFHAVMVKLRHMGGYEEGEIVAARASAAIMGFITTPEPDIADATADPEADDVVDGERVLDMSPGTIKELQPGESFTGFAPNRPNAALEPFMRFMLRAVAAGVGVSYEGISRDYSQSNYSSSRLALLDDRDNWKILQQWLIEELHQEVYEAWLEMAVLSGRLNLPAYESLPEAYHAPRWQPRGWEWVDPAREVAAAKAAVRAGFANVGDIIAAKGGDIEDQWRQRRRELDLAGEFDLVFDTDPAQVTDKGQAQATAPAEEQQIDPDDPGSADGTSAAGADADAAEAGAGNDNNTAEAAQ